jgi:hypothetical protein
MRSMLAWTLLFLATLAAAGVAEPAQACRITRPLELEPIRNADAVFTGRLIRYDLVSPQRPQTFPQYALLTVRVDRVLKGRASGDVVLFWLNSTFGFPRRMAFTSVLVAAQHDDLALWRPSPSRDRLLARYPGLMSVLQQPCSVPFILRSTRTNVELVTTVLRGGRVGPHDFSPAD